MHLKKTLLSLSFLLLILPSAGMAAPQGTSASSVVLLNGTGIQWREARRIIELYGGHVTVVLPPDVLIGEIPEAALAGLQQAAASADVVGRAAAAPPALKVVRTRADAETLLGSPGVARDGSPEQVLSSEAQAALQLLLPDKAALDPARFRVLPGGLIEEKPMNEWEAPPIHPPTPDPNNAFVANAIGNSFNNTSGFLAGDVAVGILRPESTGSASGDSINTETWTAGEVTDTLAQVTKALARLNNDSPRGNLTFVVRTAARVNDFETHQSPI